LVSEIDQQFDQPVLDRIRAIDIDQRRAVGAVFCFKPDIGVTIQVRIQAAAQCINRIVIRIRQIYRVKPEIRRRVIDFEIVKRDSARARQKYEKLILRRDSAIYRNVMIIQIGRNIRVGRLRRDQHALPLGADNLGKSA